MEKQAIEENKNFKKIIEETLIKLQKQKNDAETVYLKCSGGIEIINEILKQTKK